MVGSDATVPPASLPFRKIWRELDRKSTVSVIILLKPFALPGLADKRVCLESTVLPLIVTLASFIEGQLSNGAIYLSIFIFPFTRKNIALTQLGRRQWRKGIGRDSLMNHGLGASCCEQCTGEQERGTDVSQEHVGLSAFSISQLFLTIGVWRKC
jgi:hypothetical protein